jgi:hypothetical protein
MIAGGKVLPQEIADQIIDRTDGVPLFIEELTNAVVESSLPVEACDRYVATAPVTPLAIPTSLQESLLARLDRLAPTSDAAQIAAALGEQVSRGRCTGYGRALSANGAAELRHIRGPGVSTPNRCARMREPSLWSDAISRSRLHGRCGY